MSKKAAMWRILREKRWRKMRIDVLVNAAFSSSFFAQPASKSGLFYIRRWGYIILLSSLLTACHHDAKPTAILDNQHHRVSQAAPGQWTLVNYWAPWCEGCLREIPQLNQLAAENNVRVLGVSFDDMAEADINRFARQINIQYAVLLSDPQKSWQLPIPEVLPTSYLLDPKGQLKVTLIGPQTKASVLKEIAARG